VRVQGDSMTGAGIFNGDIAVIDRALTAIDGRIVLAILDGEFTLKRYRRKGAEQWLEPANPTYGRMDITEGCEFQVWGVVRNSIRILLD
jgi:DNA polymerase V